MQDLQQSPRQWHKPQRNDDKTLPLRNILNIIFIVLVIIGIVIYLLKPQSNWAIPIYFTAIFIKGAEVCIRMANKHKTKQ
ncbi:MAG: hypothetical protein IJ244_08930 [Bacteroidaceae bacterium]|nr:hypothetical protein [Bacteroidaceae bacterium]